MSFGKELSVDVFFPYHKSKNGAPLKTVPMFSFSIKHKKLQSRKSVVKEVYKNIFLGVHKKRDPIFLSTKKRVTTLKCLQKQKCILIFQQ